MIIVCTNYRDEVEDKQNNFIEFDNHVKREINKQLRITETIFRNIFLPNLNSAKY